MPTDRLAALARIYRLQASGEAQRIRERARLTGTDMAQALDVELSSLRKWERNLARPRPATALRWLAALDELADALSDDDQEDALAAAAGA